MATKNQQCLVRPARSFEEFHGIWWPVMLELGWDRGEKDDYMHYISAGPDGYLVVTPKEEPDKPEGFVVPFVYDNGTGWVGFFCMMAHRRGQGWGSALFQTGMDYFKSKGINVVGLDGVQEQVKTYERRGFVNKASVRLMVRDSVDDVPLLEGMRHPPQGEELVPIERIPPQVLVQSDLEHTGFKRTRLWTQDAIFTRDDTFGFALVKEGFKDILQGWILVRKCPSGFRFGPLYAIDPDRASLLLWVAMKRLAGRGAKYAVEIWMGNSMGTKVFEDAGWTYVGVDYARMWLNGIVPKEQSAGGKAEKEMFAIFDAAEG